MVTSAYFRPPSVMVILNGTLMPATSRKSDQISSVTGGGPLLTVPSYRILSGSPVAGSTATRADWPQSLTISMV